MLKTYLQITRSGMPIMAFLAALLSGNLLDVNLQEVFGLALSNYCLFAASMVINDWHDVEEDRVNKPFRAIPSGKIPVQNALYLAFFLFGLGLCFGFIVKFRFGLLSTIFTAFSLLYTLKLKRIVLVGNVCVAIWTAYPLWCWYFLAPIRNVSFPFFVLTCFFFILGREVVKTAEDVAGDSHVGIKTIATLKGVTWANRSGVTLIAVGIGFAWIPVFLATVSVLYVTIFLALSVVVLYIFGQVFLRSHVLSSSRIEKITAFMMLFAIIAFGAGFRI